jgi:D-alanyl-D-alanine carboxypeptidase
VGSITKTFTAVTVLSLVDEGLIDLDAPVTDYVTRFEIDAGITVRDALQHTSGLADEVGYLTAIFDEPTRIWSPEEVLAGIQTNDVDVNASAVHAYANTNYTVLGVLIEEVTGSPYHEVVRERVIDPLGMGGTYLAFHEEGPSVFGGYYRVFGDNDSFSGTPQPLDFDFTSVETHAWASGAMVSTARDLHVMISALFDGSIISPVLVSEMTPDLEYGLGLYAPEWTSETPLIGHDGRIPGAGTFLIHAPETGATVFTVSNADYLFVSPATGAVAEAIGVPGFRLDSD